MNPIKFYIGKQSFEFISGKDLEKNQPPQILKNSHFDEFNNNTDHFVFLRNSKKWMGYGFFYLWEHYETQCFLPIKIQEAVIEEVIAKKKYLKTEILSQLFKKIMLQNIPVVKMLNNESNIEFLQDRCFIFSIKKDDFLGSFQSHIHINLDE